MPTGTTFQPNISRGREWTNGWDRRAIGLRRRLSRAAHPAPPPRRWRHVAASQVQAADIGKRAARPSLRPARRLDLRGSPQRSPRRPCAGRCCGRLPDGRARERHSLSAAAARQWACRFCRSRPLLAFSAFACLFSAVACVVVTTDTTQARQTPSLKSIRCIDRYKILIASANERETTVRLPGCDQRGDPAVLGQGVFERLVAGALESDEDRRGLLLQQLQEQEASLSSVP